MKKKILSLAMIVCMLSIAIVGGTLAYFTDTDSALNTFTVGDVQIDLTEAAVKDDGYGNLIEDTEAARKDVGTADEDKYDYGKLYPGQSIFKDPTIQNLGSEKAYVAAKVTVKSAGDLHAILGAKVGETVYDILALDDIISGGVVTDDFTQGYLEDYEGTNPNLFGNIYEGGDFVYQEVKVEGTAKEYVLYFFIKDELETDETAVLFDTIEIKDKWTNADMAQLEDLEINVDAYAVQAYGFHNCFDAMTAAFPDDFAF